MNKIVTAIFFMLLSVQIFTSVNNTEVENPILAKQIAQWIGLHKGHSVAVHIQQEEPAFLITKVSTDGITTFKKEDNHNLSSAVFKNGKLIVLAITNQEISEYAQFDTFEKLRFQLRAFCNSEVRSTSKLLLTNDVPFVKIELNQNMNIFKITPE